MKNLRDLRDFVFRKKVKIAESDLEKKGFFENLTNKFNKKINKISNTETISEFKLIFNLIKDWYSGDYKDVDKTTIISLLGAIIYFVAPIDAVPDFIVALGFIDDASLLVFLYSKFKKEIDDYKEYKNSNLGSKNE